VAVRWALGAHVVVTWRLGEVVPTWQCGWVLGAGEVAVSLQIATNLLKRVTPAFPKKTKCKPICMPGSSFMHIADISE
jgi:hypothetical protein